MGHGLRLGRVSEREWVQAWRMRRPTMMNTFEKVIENGDTAALRPECQISFR